MYVNDNIYHERIEALTWVFGSPVVHQEAHMEVINPFIRDNQQRMVMFLDELSVRLQCLAHCIVGDMHLIM